MTDTMSQVRELAEVLRKAAGKWSASSVDLPYWQHLAKAALSQPAPDVPGAEEVELRAQIAYHQSILAQEERDINDLVGMAIMAGPIYDHLLRLLDAARAELADVREAADEAIKHADARGMLDWPIFRRLAIALTRRIDLPTAKETSHD